MNDAQISRHRNRHEGDVVTAPSREVGRAETAGGKLARSEVLHSEGKLEYLVGKLQHALKVVRPGRTFLRRMFELLKGARRGQRFLRISAAFKSDMQWWHLFIAQWNG